MARLIIVIFHNKVILKFAWDTQIHTHTHTNGNNKCILFKFKITCKHLVPNKRIIIILESNIMIINNDTSNSPVVFRILIDDIFISYFMFFFSLFLFPSAQYFCPVVNTRSSTITVIIVMFKIKKTNLIYN